MSRRPPLSRCLHWLLVWLMLGQCLQPVLASVGELHEATAHAAQAATHADVHAHAHVTTAASGLPIPEPDTPLHQLMHFAHCCGQAASVLPALPMRLPALLAGQPQAWPLAALRLSKRPNPHDRPPIVG